MVSAALVAVTDIFKPDPVLGTCSVPLLEMVPAVDVQVTEVRLVPVTVAVNASEPPEATVALLGEIETRI